MLRLIPIILISLSLSCDSEISAPDPVSEDLHTQTQENEAAGSSTTEISTQYTRDEVWVCYNPGTEMHNQECVEETYPEGCYVKGEQSVFCWLLLKPDCERSDQQYQDVCHLLRD